MSRTAGSLVSGTIIFGLGNAATLLVQVLALSLFTSYLTPADFGIISMLNVLGAVLLAVFSLGIGTSFGVCYFDGDQDERKGSTLASALAVLAPSCSVMLAIGCATSPWLAALLVPGHARTALLLWTLAGSAFDVLAIPFRLCLQFEERRAGFLWATLLSTLAAVGLNALFVISLGRGLGGMVESTAAGKLATLAIHALACRRRLGHRVERALCRDLVRFGLPMIPSFASLQVLHQGNVYVLRFIRTLDSAGLYSIGYTFGSGVTLLVTAITTAWMPFFMGFQQRTEEARELFGRIVTYYVYVAGSLSLLFYVFARPVISIMAAPPFSGASAVVGLTATAHVAAGLYRLLMPAVYFAKEVQVTGVVPTIAAVLFVIIAVPLVWAGGLLGAGIGFLLGNLLMCAMLHVWNVRRGDRYLQVEYQPRRLVGFAAVYTAFVAVALTSTASSPWDEALHLGLIWLVTVGLVFFGMLDPSERASIGTMLRR